MVFAEERAPADESFKVTVTSPGAPAPVYEVGTTDTMVAVSTAAIVTKAPLAAGVLSELVSTI